MLIDKITFSEIQRLKEFVNFIAKLDNETSKMRTNANEVIYLISNINTKRTHKNWSVCLDIYDREVQYGNRKGVYWRNWSVSFENNFLEIVAESHHSKFPLGYYENHYNFLAVINFNKTKVSKGLFNNNINAFIEDVLNYKKYIHKSLNEIEFEIIV